MAQKGKWDANAGKPFDWAKGRRSDSAKNQLLIKKIKDMCERYITPRMCPSFSPSFSRSISPSLSRSVSQSFILSVSQSPGRTDFPEFISSRRNLPRLPTLRHHRLLIPHCHCLPPRRRHDHDRQADPDSLDHHCHLGAFAHETPGRLFA